jgi:hypothetical protein
MTMIVLNKRTANVNKPHWMNNPPFMGHKLNELLVESETIGRHIHKITIEVGKLTQIEYFIVPGRWIDRLYDNGFLRRDTL